MYSVLVNTIHLIVLVCLILFKSSLLLALIFRDSSRPIGSLVVLEAWPWPRGHFLKVLALALALALALDDKVLALDDKVLALALEPEVLALALALALASREKSWPWP